MSAGHVLNIAESLRLARIHAAVFSANQSSAFSLVKQRVMSSGGDCRPRRRASNPACFCKPSRRQAVQASFTGGRAVFEVTAARRGAARRHHAVRRLHL
jgi:hypothetical protein